MYRDEEEGRGRLTSKETLLTGLNLIEEWFYDGRFIFEVNRLYVN